MNYALALACLLPITLVGQTTYQVEVGGNMLSGPAPYYQPQFLTIDLGDSVEWHQVNGWHNVAGTTALYPDNPEGFTSGEPAQGTWTYSTAFTIPGFYQYHCTQTGHSATQFGTITVLDPNGINAFTNDLDVHIFPVPVETMLNISTPLAEVEAVAIMALDGRIVLSENVSGTSSFELDVHELSAGNYLLILTHIAGKKSAHAFAKQ
ncbi:MAG: T9SS type A sorting domain-containing protein [Flavobacteriales bacterium]|nr:T9SS type A sorting domain-containing protein [Flavobacteriales bacterium]MBP9139520.1 T9SS type A sorting domain-containing protein [Flavobacteriales bacterium]HQX30343.1 T9SS type A sorting domain-containing protein [Flavobacteriales bacterium]HQX38911.1 T9SS type A sorting domain-containing protein [Flavobacteriales bacterium]HQZ41542.1 T9SS type A sorting domain-containing protein [Flavobacteriales bacterium]